MTAALWWTTLDEAALQALGSAGLLRRARAAGIGEVIVSAAAAEVEVEGLRVQLGAKGLATARCPCPASGLCRHILAAVLALQSAAHAPVADVAGEIAGLPEADILSFAGSDLGAALRLAGEALMPEGFVVGPSLTLELPGFTHPVTFLVGGGLRGAVWKGPDARRRLAIATAALILRAKRGLPLPAVADHPNHPLPDTTLIAAIASQIEASVAPVLAGCGALAADQLLDLSLSARIDAAPRLATALRVLVQQALELDQRKSGADATAFLIAAARAYVLAHALAQPAPSPDLAGSLRRNYRPVGPLGMVMLGARLWRGTTGARGLRLWGYDRTGRRWITVGAARPDGLDAAFDPRAAYRRPMLGRPSVAQMIGQSLSIDAALLSDDRQLSASCLAEAGPDAGHDLPQDTNWSTLAVRLRHELGPPLLRDARMCAALMRPTSIGSPRETGSGLVLPVFDSHGMTLLIGLDGLSGTALSGLARLPTRSCLLVEAREELGRLRLELASVVHMQNGPVVWSPSLDPLPDWLCPTAPVPGLEVERPAPISRPAVLAEELLLTALDLGQGRASGSLLAARIGVSGIADVETLLELPATPAKSLRLAWIAAELRWKAKV